MPINEMIADSLMKNLGSTKFINFIKMLGFKNRFIINNIIKKRLGVNIQKKNGYYYYYKVANIMKPFTGSTSRNVVIYSFY